MKQSLKSYLEENCNDGTIYVLKHENELAEQQAYELLETYSTRFLEYFFIDEIHHDELNNKKVLEIYPYKHIATLLERRESLD